MAWLSIRRRRRREEEEEGKGVDPHSFIHSSSSK